MDNGWTERIKELEDEIRHLEWKIYRPLKEGEMTQDGDQVLGPEEDAKWEPVTGNYRPAPSPLYPAHCQYRRPIVDELRKEMERDFFYRKCVAGKESARSKKIKVLEAENKRLRELVDGATEVVEISNFTFPAQREWKAAWLKKAAKAMKEASHEST